MSVAQRGQTSSYDNFLRNEDLGPNFLITKFETSSGPNTGGLQPAAAPMNMSADTKFTVEVSGGLQRSSVGDGKYEQYH